MKKSAGMFTLAGLLVLGSIGTLIAAKTVTSNVTTTVFDTDATGTQVLTRSDDYNGTGQAAYTSSSSGESNLVSVITDGEWKLNLAHQTLRALWITPNNPVGSQPVGPPAGYYTQGVSAGSHCFDQNGNIVPLGNVVTSSGSCEFGLNFESGGTLYKLLMSPFPLSGAGDPPPTCPRSGCPATGVATVTCDALSNGQCVNWTIVPNGSAANAGVANLYRYSSSGHTATWIYIGQYYNSFRIAVTNP